MLPRELTSTMTPTLSLDVVRSWYAQSAGPSPVPVAARVESSEVLWPKVAEILHPVIKRHPDAPVIGTPEWVQLRTDDPVLVASIFAAADQWALHQWLTQDAHIQTAGDVATALDDAPAMLAAVVSRLINPGSYMAREVA